MARKGQGGQSQSQWQPSAQSTQEFLDAFKKHPRRAELFLRFKSLQPHEQAMLRSFGAQGVEFLEEMFPDLKSSRLDPQKAEERLKKFKALVGELGGRALAFFDQLPAQLKISLVELAGADAKAAAAKVNELLKEEQRKKQGVRSQLDILRKEFEL